MNNKAFERLKYDLEYAAFNLCEKSDSDVGKGVIESTCPETTLLLAIRNLSEVYDEILKAGQRQGTERASEIVSKNKDTYGVNDYCFDYILEDLGKEIKP